MRKVKRLPPAPVVVSMLSALLTIGAAAQPTPALPPPSWLDALTFYASFDGSFSADLAGGDAVLYTAPSWTDLEAAEPVSAAHEALVRFEERGRFGEALRFQTDWDPIVFYKAADNIAYRAADWSGTFSFWLRIVPDAELEPGYSDPFIVTDKNWDDASLYVDFTQDDRPRHFRFAAFSGRAFWNPEGRAWEQVLPADRPMIDLEQTPFHEGAWTHVAFTFQHFNDGAEKGILTGYLNGEQVGRLADRAFSLAWQTDRTLMAIGRHYAGALDELAVFDRALTDEEIASLFKRPIKQALASDAAGR
jgi:hypothetical protein